MPALTPKAHVQHEAKPIIAASKWAPDTRIFSPLLCQETQLEVVLNQHGARPWWLTLLDEIDAFAVDDAIQFGGAMGARLSLPAGLLDQVEA